MKPLRLSQSCLDVNPQLSAANGKKNPVAGRARTRVGLQCGMNKTEAEFALILEEKKQKGEILRYLFEGITLRFAGVKYTPDFVVIERETHTWAENDPKRQNPPWHGIVMKFIEVKGPFIGGNRERAVERFRHAKTFWPEFTFELHQKTKDGWRQLI